MFFIFNDGMVVVWLGNSLFPRQLNALNVADSAQMSNRRSAGHAATVRLAVTNWVKSIYQHAGSVILVQKGWGA
ncbi:MAG: hypothetical protein D6768_08640 [Chloroflexi bacterium]|nr:MAG: hypothetical protein D6768_08640 [Chloroflexota bacterium]